RIQKSAGIFNVERLDWYNKEYIKKLSPKDLEIRVSDELGTQDEIFIKKITPIVIDRINKFSDIKKIKKEELSFFFNEPEYAKEMLLWKKDPDMEKTKKHLQEVVKLVSLLSENKFNQDKIKETVWNYAEKEGKGNVLWPMRVALTGMEKSPDPFAVAGVLGKEKTIKRLIYAIEKI
ncbi:MAG: hypothetical protein AAB822_01670, partial [Patescibacteria group bacterium]